MRRFWAFFGAVTFTLLLGLIVIQEKLIFFPEKLESNYAFNIQNASEFYFTFESLSIHSLLFSEPHSQELVLYFHGNAGSLKNWALVGEELRDKLKLNVWILDYPGFGKSEGSISSERQLLALAEQFYLEAKAKFPLSKLIIYGRSIGTGPASWLAAKYKAPLILETPYSSFSKLASQHAPWFPSLLRRYSFKTSEWLNSFQEPLLLLHGTRDEVIPHSHSIELSEKIPGSYYVEIEGATHNNLSEAQIYWNALTEFIDKTIRSRSL